MSNLHCSLTNATLCPLVLLPSLSLKNIIMEKIREGLKNGAVIRLFVSAGFSKHEQDFHQNIILY